MCVHDCPDLVRQVVEPKVHLDLRGGHHPVGSLQYLALGVDLDEYLRRQIALAYSRWGAEDLVRRKSSRDVAVVCGHHPSVPKILAKIADLRSQVLLVHFLDLSDRDSQHFNDWLSSSRAGPPWPATVLAGQAGRFAG